VSAWEMGGEYDRTPPDKPVGSGLKNGNGSNQGIAKKELCMGSSRSARNKGKKERKKRGKGEKRKGKKPGKGSDRKKGKEDSRGTLTTILDKRRPTSETRKSIKKRGRGRKKRAG